MMKTLVAVLIASMAAGAAKLALAQADTIAQRQDNRTQAAAAMRAIKGVIDAKGSTSGALPHAAKLKELEIAFVRLFPAGSDKGNTNAIAAIWSDNAGFQSASNAAKAAYDRLAVAAGSGDLAALTSAWNDQGKACGACHDKFRAR